MAILPPFDAGQRSLRACHAAVWHYHSGMGITITIPEEVARVLGAGQAEREQRACETIALELYREGQISLRTMGMLAGLGDDYWAADAFRARHGLAVVDCEDDLACDRAVLDDLLKA